MACIPATTRGTSAVRVSCLLDTNTILTIDDGTKGIAHCFNCTGVVKIEKRNGSNTEPHGRQCRSEELTSDIHPWRCGAGGLESVTVFENPKSACVHSPKDDDDPECRRRH